VATLGTAAGNAGCPGWNNYEAANYQPEGVAEKGDMGEWRGEGGPDLSICG